MAIVVKYRWLDPFTGVYSETPCEVLEHTDKTAVIKLLGCGRNNALPGTIMRVRLKSLIGFSNPSEEDIENWHRSSYFD